MNRARPRASTRAFALTSLAMAAFAGNSLLCRAALAGTAIDAATFTAVRILSGALALGAIEWLRARGRGEAGSAPRDAGSWFAALALSGYAAGFSFAYRELTAATGALLLFGAVQATMIGYGIARGERPRPRQLFGLLAAILGLVALLLPGLAAPPLRASLLMLAAGAAWGIYSLLGRGAADPTRVTAGNFLRAVPFAAVLAAVGYAQLSLDLAGVGLAAVSGALTSGVGYALWYSALRYLTTTGAATVQLSVPVLVSAAGILFLGESLSLRLVVAGAAILGGVALVLVEKSRSASR